MPSIVYTISDMKSSSSNLSNFISKHIQLNSEAPVLFYGDMGIGKTTTIKFILSKYFKQELFQQQYCSPTFNIINYYPEIDVYHCDLSRITNREDPILKDIIYNIEQDIYIIEWPEIIEHSLKNYIKIYLEYIDCNTRKLKIATSI